MAGLKVGVQTYYACTCVEKTVEVDDYEYGCMGSPTCSLFDQVNITSSTVAGLMEAMGRQYGLDIDDVWVPDEEVRFIGFNRLETGDAEEPTPKQKERWKKGKETLYLSDYHFVIEKRTVEPVRKEEFLTIKHHG